MTKKETAKFAILKWQIIINNNGRYLSSNQILKFGLNEFYSNCSFCNLYIKNDCKKCPLNLNGEIACFNIGHPYKIWEITRTKENAQKMLDLIHKVTNTLTEKEKTKMKIFYLFCLCFPNHVNYYKDWREFWSWIHAEQYNYHYITNLKNHKQIISFIFYKKSIKENKNNVHVSLGGTHPKFRNKKIYKNLRAQILTENCPNAGDVVTCTVRDSNIIMRQFLEKNEYICTKIIKNYYNNGENALRYEKKI